MWKTLKQCLPLLAPCCRMIQLSAETVWLVLALGCGAVSTYHDISQQQYTDSKLQWSSGQPWLRGKHLPTLLSFQRAHAYFTGNVGCGNVCVEPTGASDHPEGENVPPSAAQPGGFHGHLRRDGGRSGHASQPRPWAQRPPLETGPRAVPGVDLLRRALLHSQHLERDCHRVGPLLVHHEAPGVHSQDTQKDL